MKTFESNKTITELWIDISRKFVVVEEGNFNKWDILTLDCDDDSVCPHFRNQRGECNYTSLYKLAYYEEEETKKETKPLPRWVYVSDESIEEALRAERRRQLVHELPENFSSKYICVNDGEMLENWRHITVWEHIAEIPPEEEKIKMTLEEIEQALGKKIEIIN